MPVFEEHPAQGRRGVRLAHRFQQREYRYFTLTPSRGEVENTLIGAQLTPVDDSIYATPKNQYGYTPFVPRCNQVPWVEEVLPGITFVNARFESVPWPGEAYVTVGFMAHSERKLRDLSGEPVEGIDPDDAEYSWTQTAGDGNTTRVRLVATIHTSVYAPNAGGWWAGTTCVNSNTMTKLATFLGLSGAPGKWLLLPNTTKPIIPPMAHAWDVAFQDYSFAYELRGWNNLTKARQYQKVVDVVPAREEGAPDRKVIGRKWVGNEQARQDFEEYNFGLLDACIVGL